MNNKLTEDEWLMDALTRIYINPSAVIRIASLRKLRAEAATRGCSELLQLLQPLYKINADLTATHTYMESLSEIKDILKHSAGEADKHPVSYSDSGLDLRHYLLYNMVVDALINKIAKLSQILSEHNDVDLYKQTVAEDCKK